MNADRLLDFWFAGTRKDPKRIPKRNAWWFQADPKRDELLRERFGGDCEAARSGRLNDLADSARGRLALVLLLDQLPRNLYRGTPEAFSSDQQALAHCLEANETGQHQALSLIERAFLWMPFQHSEDLVYQEEGVRRFRSLAKEDPEHEEIWVGFADYALLHRDIITRFGRFPHRNKVLGRASTEEELQWLNQDGRSFGQ